MRPTQMLMAGAGALALLAAAPAGAAVLEAEYFFNNTLSSSVGGAPALTATDPLGASGFTTDTVFGQSRTVYSFNGNATPTNQQAGLTFDNSGGLITHNNYSIDMVVKLTQRDSAWRRLVDVQNRQSDNGFYVDPSNHLDIFPVNGGGTFTTNLYHELALTVASSGTVAAYIDGTFAFSVSTTIMDIANADNPGNLVNFFLDNVVAGGQGEFSDGDVAAIRLYDGILSAGDIGTLAANEFPTAATGVAEPASLAMLGLGLIGLGLLRRRR